MFIPKSVCFFEAVVNRILKLSFSNFVLLVCKNSVDYYLLTVYF